jgi:peptidoglycan hydrolase CwlO-like protein
MKSALPKAVQAQIDQANAIITEINKKPADLAPAPLADAAPASTPPAPAAAPAPAPTPAPAAAPAPAEDSAEHKYKVLQGKYNAEVPRLQRTVHEQNDLIKELRQQQNNLEGLIAGMSATRAPAPADSTASRSCRTNGSPCHGSPRNR